MTNTNLTRRSFLQSTAATALLTTLPASARAAIQAGNVQALDTGWQFHQGASTAEAARAMKDGWQSVTVPHCVNAYDACDPDHPYYQGQSWYKLKANAINPHHNGRTLLRFRGAGQTTTVWHGNTLLGTHIGGYDEFVFDVTDAGPTLDLLVCADNSIDDNRSPSNLSDFCLYGGLYRHVELIYLPALAIDSVKLDIQCEATGAATLHVSASLHGSLPANPFALRIDIHDASNAIVASKSMQQNPWADTQELAQIKLDSPKRWSPATPHLYRCRVTLGDTVIAEERFGVRHIDFPENDVFSLNGEKLFLRGTQRHQDHAGVAGAQSDDSVRKEMQLVKEMGANFIRLGHYQQDRLVLDLCDELGILVWEEVPWCRAGVGSEAWKENTRTQMRNTVAQHYNHPSIVFWGLGNEDDWPDEKPSVNKDAIRAFMSELNDLTHKLDPKRLTSYRRCDFARDIPDVYSPSIWAGWYNGTYHEYAKSLADQMPKQKRFLHIEWGADHHAGRHSEDPYANLGGIATNTGTNERAGDYKRTGGPIRVAVAGDWSETYACDLFDWYLKTQKTIPNLAGTAQWVFKDFASPLRADSPVPRVNQKGVLARDLTPKESYAVFQSYWSAKPMIHIYGHTWPRRWGKPGEMRQVKVYSNCAEVELFLNGVSLGARKRDPQQFPAANLHWDVAFRPGENQLRAVSRSSATPLEDKLTLTYQTETWSRPATLRLKHLRDTTYQAEVFDAAGIRCLDARTPIRFSVTGDLVMLDNLGTVGGSRLVEAANGVATITLHRKGAGKLFVSAKDLTGDSVPV